MHDGGLRRHARRRGAGAAGAAAEVGLLAVHHEGEVEAAHALPEVAGDQEEAARDDVDVALASSGPSRRSPRG